MASTHAMPASSSLRISLDTLAGDSATGRTGIPRAVRNLRIRTSAVKTLGCFRFRTAGAPAGILALPWWLSSRLARRLAREGGAPAGAYAPLDEARPLVGGDVCCLGRARCRF